MTQPLESIVRPFQLPERADASRSIQPGQKSIQPIALQFGRSGGGKTMQGSYSYSASIYCDQHVVEKTTDPNFIP